MTTPEASVRKPEFTEGRMVRLADGQEWTFPAPVLALAPYRKEDGSLGLRRSPPFGPDFQAGLDRYIDRISDESDDDVLETLTMRLTLAVDLLSRNYNLTDGLVETLFSLDLASDESLKMWDEIDSAIIGRSPKKA